MLLVLLEPVNRAGFKYVCSAWIGSQIWKINVKTLTIMHTCPKYFYFHKNDLEAHMKVLDRKKCRLQSMVFKDL